MSRDDLIYLAGIVDGEGCVIIEHGSAWFLRVQVGNTDSRLMDWLKDSFGGAVHPQRRENPQHKPAFMWVIASRQAADLLAKIRPFLKLKGEQADIALAFQNTMHKRGGSRRLTNEEIQQRQTYKEEIAVLNHRGAQR